MSEECFDELLVDLARLFRKHGADAFNALSKAISAPDVAQRLATLLEGVSRAGATAAGSARRRVPRAGGTKVVEDLLAALKESDPQKHQLLAAFREGFLSGAILPSLKDVRVFAARWDLSLERAESRRKAFAPVMRALSELPAEQIADKLKSVSGGQEVDRELQGWTRLILDRERRPK